MFTANPLRRERTNLSAAQSSLPARNKLLKDFLHSFGRHKSKLQRISVRFDAHAIIDMELLSVSLNRPTAVKFTKNPPRRFKLDGNAM